MTADVPALTPRPTAAVGVAVFPARFEEAVAWLRAAIDTLAADEPFDRLAVPPVIARQTVERAGYVATFPHLLGTVHSFQDDARTWRSLLPEATVGGAWHRHQRPTDVVLTPAACYHVYPELDGARIDEPLRYSVEGHCYRQEATAETGRLRSFRMRELVCVGSAGYCAAWRNRWRDRVAGWLTGLGLDVQVVVATDPFFGPAERMMRASQAEQELKVEFVVPVGDGLRQAVASANYHKEHFGAVYAMATPGGEPAHSACVAFGLERIVLALIHAHDDRLDALVERGRRGAVGKLFGVEG